MATPTQLIGLWAHPRSRSTVFFRMMQNRGDFLVVHEPFCTLADTGRVEIPDGSGGWITLDDEHALVEALLALATRQPVFFKETCDHRYRAVETHRTFLGAGRHAFIVREPKSTIASHYNVNPNVSCSEIGYENLYRIYEAVTTEAGEQPLVLDGDRLAAAPERMVQAFCRRFGLHFDAAHLNWRPEELQDWARTSHWHKDVSRSTGFQRDSRRYEITVENCDRLRDFYDYHAPFYQEMEKVSIR